WLPNGTLEYLGRMDQQVKIRGYRIEPGEIQNHLVQLEGIEEAFVTVREGQDGDKVLCAYFSATESKDLTELRGQLMKDLPPYMIPSYFVQVERLPLTPNGKVNRTALPEPSGANQSGTKFVAPRNEVEEMLVKIWREVLQLDRKTKSEEPRISVLDHFFELGGHSLKAMELLNRIKQSFHVHLPLPEVFKDPTIQGMAKRIQQGQKIDHAPIPSLEKKEYYPVSFSQKRMYLLSQFDQQQIHYNMPGVLLLEGKVDIERLEKAFNLLIERHEGLRTTFKMIDQEVVQIINEKVDFKLHDPSRNLEVYQTTVRTQEPTIEEMMKDFVQPLIYNKLPY
ncbi:condensation domain-containing protein, partial [Caldalkalibacillus mannanilyticus]|uniref:condensation domain-containing protein n=1 Tax=Caldalkalibacillus mannanilyticus TaxID=1418 RepID=UPI0005539B5A